MPHRGTAAANPYTPGMAEPPVRIDAVRDVAIATRTAVVDRGEQPPTSLAVAVAEALGFWPAALAAACIAAGTAYVALDPANAKRTGTLLLRGPTEPIGAVGTPTDLARFVASVEARTEAGDPIDFTVRSERGSELATLVVGLGPKDGPPEAAARARRVAEAANASLSDAIDRARAGIDASLASTARSATETTELLRSISAANPQSEAIAGLMQQVTALRDEQAKLMARSSGLQGIRVVGDVEVSAGRSTGLRLLATAAAAVAGLVVTPLLLRFARQVADARRALRAAQAR